MPQALTEKEFLRMYPPLVAQDLAQREIAQRMGISRRTLNNYINKWGRCTEVAQVVQETREIQNGIAMMQGNDMADKVIDTAYNTTMIAIAQATQDGRKEDAADMALRALKIADTINRKKQVVHALQVNLDQRQQKVNVVSVFDRAEELRQRCGGRCPVCGGVVE